MRIVVIGAWAPSMIPFRGHLLATMVEMGHTVVACAADGTPEIAAGLAAMGVTYHELPLARAGINPIFDAKTLAALIALLRRERPDLVLGYSIKPVIYGTVAARIVGVPRVYALISGLGYAFTNQTRAKHRILAKLAREVFRRSLAFTDGIIFQNPDDIRDFREWGILRADQPVTMVNGSGVDLEHYSLRPLPDGAATFLFVGRMLKEKGVVEFVEAAQAVKRDFPNARFQLLGRFDANPASLSSAQMSDWERQGIVEYLGETEDVRPYIESAHALVLPSYYREGTPRSVLEAMAMGRAIVTTDAPGCRETVKDGYNGFLVPVRDSQALATAMHSFLRNPTLFSLMGQRSREVAERKYDVRFVTRDMLTGIGLLRSSPV